MVTLRVNMPNRLYKKDPFIGDKVEQLCDNAGVEYTLMGEPDKKVWYEVECATLVQAIGLRANLAQLGLKV